MHLKIEHFTLNEYDDLISDLTIHLSQKLATNRTFISVFFRT